MVEIEDKGGLTNAMLMKDEEGKINYFAVLGLYSCIFLVLFSLYHVFKSVVGELDNSKMRES